MMNNQVYKLKNHDGKLAKGYWVDRNFKMQSMMEKIEIQITRLLNKIKQSNIRIRFDKQTNLVMNLLICRL